jgi:hypothetical protein
VFTRRSNRLMTCLPSGRLHHEADGLDESLPFALLGCQLVLARSGEPVVLRALTFLGHLPFRFQPTLLFQPMERWIERSGLDSQKLFGFLSDPLRDSQPVLRSPLQRLQDEHVQRPLQNIHLVLPLSECHDIDTL